MAHVSRPFPYAGGKLELYPNIRTELCLSFSLYFLSIVVVTTLY